MKLNRVLIANRGEIAIRIVYACQALGIETVVAVSQADRHSLPARLADRSICIGPASASQSYLDYRKIVMAALGTECDAVHPGYGFLAESPELAQACIDNGLIFVGPRPEHIRRMGNKIEARLLARQYGIPTLPGSEKVDSVQDAMTVAKTTGLPLMMKAAAGGGGRGMKVVSNIDQMPQQFAAASSEAAAAFGDSTLYLEKYIEDARHVEVQVLGDSHGNVVHLGERDCSLQRRHQKLVEEAPAAGLSDQVRADLHQAAVKLARNFGYENAGTVEFILDQKTGEFYFLEMNTRIQVEHPVTELITGIDLVQEQFRVARGEVLRYRQEDIVVRGHAIESRINAEAVADNFMPSPGEITKWQPPQGPNIRVDSHCYAGYAVPIFYDSMVAKLIVYGINRQEAIDRLRRALGRFEIEGIQTTIELQHFLISHSAFKSSQVTTHVVDDLLPAFVDSLAKQGRV